MVIFTIFSLGIYLPIWFLKQKNVLNNLNLKNKLNSWPFIVVLIIFTISLVLFGFQVYFVETQVGKIIDEIDSLIRFCGWIIILVMSFKVGKMLSEYFNKDLSRAGIFFFSVFYLQYKINEFISLIRKDKRGYS